ncbi:hypothetical protein M948_16465 [Virgibacillus sp. CM-4]|uniref:YndJ family protein n=1 Tax=Virgibacillus sp. CM-4 TaxID=1354277 RepID=UPI0003886E74|nr:YndJ family protein [Virgibacillus sp. CM-4]EQB36625.1 hypothetical protein M948_16465 [Virgibacillus sp. CM-4]
MTFLKVAGANSILFIIIALTGNHSWYFLLLTAAQLLFVPCMLHIVLRQEESWISTYFPYAGIMASISIFILQFSQETSMDTILAILYLLFTVMIALYGVKRFLQRGFAYFEEFIIDIGLIYILIGGMWFVAHIATIDTGFSPMITWLTVNHFHYAACILPISVGLLGRLYKSKMYKWVSSMIIISPVIVALGITFSVKIEFLSVILYIIAIYGLIHLSFKVVFKSSLQKWLICISNGALCVSILFSLLYAVGNLSGWFSVSIDFMILFHGIINSIVFAGFGTAGWIIAPPFSNQRNKPFPRSKIKGKGIIGEEIIKGKTDNQFYNGLVDCMEQYANEIQLDTLSQMIIDFYENTKNYQLFAEVRWKNWFKPLAIIYRQISRIIKQLNLPLSSRRQEMTGAIHSIDDRMDGRTNVRAWVRKIKNEVIFVALYSSHQNNDQTYMNIALPLPGTAMIGILELSQYGEKLQLSSKKLKYEQADSGIYLIVGKGLFKLPIEETFEVEETNEGKLKAKHQMWLFSIPFLNIDYDIVPSERQNENIKEAHQRTVGIGKRGGD